LKLKYTFTLIKQLCQEKINQNFIRKKTTIYNARKYMSKDR